MSATRRNCRLDSSEDQIISLHPYAPTHHNNDFHKERHIQLILELIKGGKRIILPHYHTNSVPTGLSKRTMNEEMH